MTSSATIRRNHPPRRLHLSIATLKALADRVRWGVVLALIDGPRSVGELERGLGVEQSLLSHHLQRLRSRQVVTARRQGKRVLYELCRGTRSEGDRTVLDLGCCSLVFAAGQKPVPTKVSAAAPRHGGKRHRQ